MKDYVVVVLDSFEGISEDKIIIKNVKSLYADGLEIDYQSYTNIVINEEIVIKLPNKFINYMEVKND